jgi:hypothetical protein
VRADRPVRALLEEGVRAVGQRRHAPGREIRRAMLAPGRTVTTALLRLRCLAGILMTYVHAVCRSLIRTLCC